MPVTWSQFPNLYEQWILSQGNWENGKLLFNTFIILIFIILFNTLKDVDDVQTNLIYSHEKRKKDIHLVCIS